MRVKIAPRGMHVDGQHEQRYALVSDQKESVQAPAIRMLPHPEAELFGSHPGRYIGLTTHDLVGKAIQHGRRWLRIHAVIGTMHISSIPPHIVCRRRELHDAKHTNHQGNLYTD